jgi:hypothetical protein
VRSICRYDDESSRYGLSNNTPGFLVYRKLNDKFSTAREYDIYLKWRNSLSVTTVPEYKPEVSYY